MKVIVPQKESYSTTEGKSTVSTSIFRSFERSLVWPKYRLLEIKFQWFPLSFEEPVYLLGYGQVSENFGSIPARGTTFITYSKCPDWLRSPASLHWTGTRSSFSEHKVTGL